MLFRDEIEQSTDTSNLCDSQSNSDIYIQYHPILNYYRDKVKMLHNTILDLQENNEYLTNDIVELEMIRNINKYKEILKEKQND